MALMNDRAGWGLVQRALHWMTGGVILFQLGLGFYMTEFVTDLIQQYNLVQLHKSWGFVAFVLVALRLAWRAINPTPLAPNMPLWQHMASEGTHIALYVLMIALPVTGWLMSTASTLNDPDAYPAQIPNLVFGAFDMPDLFPKGDDALAGWFETLHAFSAFGIAVLVALHIAAALKHHFVDRDGVLRRMVVGRAEDDRAEHDRAETAPARSQDA
ncbi:MAG: cytochrome b [Pseudomonadota bacterium]